jgi:hypothetical protein
MANQKEFFQLKNKTKTRVYKEGQLNKKIKKLT